MFPEKFGYTRIDKTGMALCIKISKKTIPEKTCKNPDFSDVKSGSGYRLRLRAVCPAPPHNLCGRKKCPQKPAKEQV
jgi:hypothetical protein